MCPNIHIRGLTFALFEILASKNHPFVTPGLNHNFESLDDLSGSVDTVFSRRSGTVSSHAVRLQSRDGLGLCLDESRSGVLW